MTVSELAKRTILAACVAALVSGCGTASDRFGVAVTFTIPSQPLGLANDGLGTIRSLVIEANGDETYATTIDLAGRNVERTETAFYVPSAPTRTLALTGTALDATGDIVLTGNSGALSLTAGKTTTTEIVLVRPGVLLDDMGVTDPSDGAGEPADFSGFDGAMVPTYSHLVTVDRASVGQPGSGVTTLADFPMLVRYTDDSLRSQANAGHVVSSSGDDIEFIGKGTALCGGPPVCSLDSELEAYDPATGAIVAWVRLPTLNTVNAGSNTTFTMRYGIPATKARVPTAVWNGGYRGVWHLGDTNGVALDSTPGGHHGTRTNTTAVAGSIGGGTKFDGTSSRIDVPSALLLNFAAAADFTISARVQTTQPFASGGTPMVLSKSSDTNPPGYSLVSRSGSDGSPWSFGLVAGAASSGATAMSNIVDGSWHQLTAVRLSGTLYLYQDGSQVGSNVSAAVGVVSATALRFGAGTTNASDPNNFFQGNLDEIRISGVGRGADWLKTESAVGAATVGPELFQ